MATGCFLKKLLVVKVWSLLILADLSSFFGIINIYIYIYIHNVYIYTFNWMIPKIIWVMGTCFFHVLSLFLSIQWWLAISQQKPPDESKLTQVFFGTIDDDGQRKTKKHTTHTARLLIPCLHLVTLIFTMIVWISWPLLWLAARFLKRWGPRDFRWWNSHSWWPDDNLKMLLLVQWK